MQKKSHNNLLNALSEEIHKRLLPEEVEICTGQILYERGNMPKYAYFPLDAIVSLVYAMESGGSAEIAVVGKEGLVGVALFLGGENMPHRAAVQISGRAYRVKSAALIEEFKRAGALQHLLLCYIQALLTQMAQTAVCNRHHTVERQLCRWLLMTLDRLPSNQVSMTQELIANMLGVRREGVTEAAGRLQSQNLIKYSRGHITVLDRDGLEKCSCECYAVVKAEFNRLLPGSAPG